MCTYCETQARSFQLADRLSSDESQFDGGLFFLQAMKSNEDIEKGQWMLGGLNSPSIILPEDIFTREGITKWNWLDAEGVLVARNCFNFGFYAGARAEKVGWDHKKETLECWLYTKCKEALLSPDWETEEPE